MRYFFSLGLITLLLPSLGIAKFLTIDDKAKVRISVKPQEDLSQPALIHTEFETKTGYKKTVDFTSVRLDPDAEINKEFNVPEGTKRLNQAECALFGVNGPKMTSSKQRWIIQLTINCSVIFNTLNRVFIDGKYFEIDFENNTWEGKLKRNDHFLKQSLYGENQTLTQKYQKYLGDKLGRNVKTHPKVPNIETDLRLRLGIYYDHYIWKTFTTYYKTDMNAHRLLEEFHTIGMHIVMENVAHIHDNLRVEVPTAFYIYNETSHVVMPDEACYEECDEKELYRKKFSHEPFTSTRTRFSHKGVSGGPKDDPWMMLPLKKDKCTRCTFKTMGELITPLNITINETAEEIRTAGNETNSTTVDDYDELLSNETYVDFQPAFDLVDQWVVNWGFTYNRLLEIMEKDPKEECAKEDTESGRPKRWFRPQSGIAEDIGTVCIDDTSMAFVDFSTLTDLKYIYNTVDIEVYAFIASHEIGHTLGAFHDFQFKMIYGSPNCPPGFMYWLMSYCHLYGAWPCDQYEGQLFGFLELGEGLWSPCTKYSFNVFLNFLKSNNQLCLADERDT